MNKGYPLNLRRYRLVRKKDNKYHPAYSHNHVEKEAQLFAGRSKVLSRIAATSIHTENHITNVTNKESKLCNIHGTILLYFTSRIRKMQNVVAVCIFAFRCGKPAIGLPAANIWRDRQPKIKRNRRKKQSIINR